MKTLLELCRIYIRSRLIKDIKMYQKPAWFLSIHETVRENFPLLYDEYRILNWAILNPDRDLKYELLNAEKHDQDVDKEDNLVNNYINDGEYDDDFSVIWSDHDDWEEEYLLDHYHIE